MLNQMRIPRPPSARKRQCGTDHDEPGGQEDKSAQGPVEGTSLFWQPITQLGILC